MQFFEIQNVALSSPKLLTSFGELKICTGVGIQAQPMIIFEFNTIVNQQPV